MTREHSSTRPRNGSATGEDRELRMESQTHEVLAPDWGDLCDATASDALPSDAPTSAPVETEAVRPTCAERSKVAAAFMATRLPLRRDGSLYPLCSRTPSEDVASFSVGWAFYLSDVQRVAILTAVLCVLSLPLVIYNFVMSVIAVPDVHFVGFTSRLTNFHFYALGVTSAINASAAVVIKNVGVNALILPPTEEVPWWYIAFVVLNTLIAVAFFSALKTSHHLRDRQLQEQLVTPSSFTVFLAGLPQSCTVDDVARFFSAFGEVGKVCLHARIDPELISLEAKRSTAKAIVDDEGWVDDAARVKAGEACAALDASIKARWVDFFTYPPTNLLQTTVKKRRGSTFGASGAGASGGDVGDEAIVVGPKEPKACFISFTSIASTRSVLRQFQGAKQLARERNRLSDVLAFYAHALFKTCGAKPLAVPTDDGVPDALPWKHAILRSCVEPNDVAWKHVNQQGMTAELRRCRVIRLAAAIALLGLLMLVLVVLQLVFQFTSFAQHSKLLAAEFPSLFADLYETDVGILPSTGAALLQVAVGSLIGTLRFLTFAAFVPGLNGLARYWSASHLQRANFLWCAVVEVFWFSSINITSAVAVYLVASTGTDVAWSSASAIAAANLEFWTLIFFVDISLFTINQLGRCPIWTKRLWALATSKAQVELNVGWIQPADTPYWLYKNVVKVTLIVAGVGPWSPAVYFGAACEMLVTFYAVRLVLTRFAEAPIMYRSFIGETASVFFAIVSIVAAASTLFFVGEATKYNVWVMLPLVLVIILDWIVCAALGWDDVRGNAAWLLQKLRCPCCDAGAQQAKSLIDSVRLKAGRGSESGAPARARGAAFDIPLEEGMPPPPPEGSASVAGTGHRGATPSGELKQALAQDAMPVGFFGVEAKSGSFAPRGFIGEAKIFAEFNPLAHLRGQYHESVDSIGDARKKYADALPPGIDTSAGLAARLSVSLAGTSFAAVALTLPVADNGHDDDVLTAVDLAVEEPVMVLEPGSADAAAFVAPRRSGEGAEI